MSSATSSPVEIITPQCGVCGSYVPFETCNSLHHPDCMLGQHAALREVLQKAKEGKLRPYHIKRVPAQFRDALPRLIIKQALGRK